MAKKKLTKQEKKRIEAEKAETLRIEMEKERQKLLEEERKRKIQELQEAKERQKREKRENKIRKVQLAESFEHFERIRKKIENIRAEFRKQKEWKRYMRCNGLPNAYDPGDLRKYLHMWSLSTDHYDQIEQNWLLQTDERSILTQNQLIPNRTRDNLQKQQCNLGDTYSERAVEVLGILDEINEAIMDPFSLSSSIVKDLNRLKFEFQLKLSQFIDQFAFKILSNVDRDMILESLLIATHLYESRIFKIHLWTKRDIPQPQLNEKEKQKEAKKYIAIDFTTIKLNLCLPPAVKCKNSAIRAMWLNYDHFSDCCSSFTLPCRFIPNLDISIAARKEWKKRRELMKMAIEEKDNETNNLELGAVPFDNLEQQPISTIIDVDKLYAEYIEERDKKKQALKGIGALNLREFELNLRKYRIVGGIYCLEYVEQPEQNVKISTNTFLRTIIGSNTLKRRQFFQYYRPPAPTPAGVRRLPEEVETELKAIEKGLNKLAYVTIVLPDNVMWFEPPTVCRWETPEETKASERLENKRSESIYATEEAHNISGLFKKLGKIIEDFNLFDIPPSVDLQCVMKEFVVPRLPNGYTIQIHEVAAQRKSSVFRIIHGEEDDLIKPVKPRTFQHIKEVLKPTDSPRPLHPKVVIKRQMKLIEKPTVHAEPDNTGIRIYMFSKLLSDLDELCDKQIPYVEKQIEEISEILSHVSASIEDGVEASETSEKNFSEIPFTRGEDFPWGLQKKEVIDENPSVGEDDEESEEDSIDLDSEDEYVKTKDTDMNENFGRWSTRDVHDPKFNEEKLAIQFRSGRLGYFGLAINWYCNFPYQTWELKPDAKGSTAVIFSLTAAVVSIEASITASGITLNSFQGGISSNVQNAIGESMTFERLKHILMQSGINLFPDDDAFCYCETACEKNIIMETHLYICMGYLGLTHNFMWSRWNILSNNRSAVLLMREVVEQRKIPNFSTLLVTPLKACMVECTEVSTSFNANPSDGMNFYADLYHLNEEHSSADAKERQQNMSPLQRENVIQVLRTIRPLSFC